MNNDPDQDSIELQERRDRVARLVDAVDEIHRTLEAFQRYVQQPLAVLCEYYWNNAIKQRTGSDPLIVVPQSSLVSFNPEPDNPHSGIQLLYLPDDIEPSEENLASLGIPMCRVCTERYSVDIELVSVQPSDDTVNMIEDVLQNAVNDLVAEIENKINNDGAACAECLVTPLQGAVTMDPNNFMKLSVYMFTRVGIRNGSTMKPISA